MQLTYLELRWIIRHFKFDEANIEIKFSKEYDGERVTIWDSNNYISINQPTFTSYREIRIYDSQSDSYFSTNFDKYIGKPDKELDNDILKSNRLKPSDFTNLCDTTSWFDLEHNKSRIKTVVKFEELTDIPALDKVTSYDVCQNQAKLYKRLLRLFRGF